MSSHNKHKKKLNRVFIANRGEICRRIAISARKMGLETVCLTENDRPPTFLQAHIDKFIKVESETTSLYLNQEAMIRFAQSESCDCLHPGFGFLSENADFANLVETNSLTWIGPPATAMQSMADKSRARAIAMEANVPCIMGTSIDLEPSKLSSQLEELANYADKTGYPILIKAALGGGGKGMRVVNKRSELEDALQKSHSEALNSFGDGNLIVEKYFSKTRHIEVQVLGDRYGHVFIVGDRDCSLQRRHQKIVEECPAPDLSANTRKRLHESAKKLAEKVGYFSAGTVEYILDCSNESEDFYFLEMNTRLQVEHPVTEQVHRIDLVAWQFKIAAGEALVEDVSCYSPKGCSVEVRLYCEDINQNFFPSPGLIEYFEANRFDGIRWEAGIDSSDIVTTKFDPMIAKVISTADNRTLALEQLVKCLKNTKLVGPPNNKNYLIHLLSQTSFKTSPCQTHFIADQHESICKEINEEYKKSALITENLFTSVKSSFSVWKQSNHNAPVISADFITKGAFNKALRQYNLKSSKHLEFSLSHWSKKPLDHEASATIAKGFFKNEDKLDSVDVTIITRNGASKTYLHHNGYDFLEKENSADLYSSNSEESGRQIVSQVPGKIVKIHKQSGDTVKKGESVFVLESMKMEFDVKAASDGSIESINVNIGDQVQSGTILSTIENT